MRSGDHGLIPGKSVTLRVRIHWFQPFRPSPDGVFLGLIAVFLLSGAVTSHRSLGGTFIFAAGGISLLITALAIEAFALANWRPGEAILTDKRLIVMSGVFQNRAVGIFPSGVESASNPLPSRKLPITVVIPALNEAVQIREAVAALAWADEVILVDGGSTDDTPELACAAGAKVMRVANQTIAAQRNAGIAAARNRWVLALDADERVTDALRAELESVLAAPAHEAYRIQLQNIYLGRELRHGGWGRDWHIRLFPRERRFVEKRVHESLESVSDVGSLNAKLTHTPYRDLSHHLEKMIRYAKWGADDLYARGRRVNVWDLTAVPIWRFLREYVVYSGWRDGRRGLVVAALGACAALLKFAHLFALQWQSETSRPAARHDGAQKS